MKRHLLFTAAALVLATAAFAGPKKDAKVPTTIACAVMGSRTVNVKSATANHMYADYKGNRYFFCCGGCPAQFKADPAKFVKSAHIAAPKTSVKG